MADRVADQAYPCPVCGYMSFSRPPGSDEVCPICFWRDDVRQLHLVGMPLEGNTVCLLVAQDHYKNFGAVEHRFKPFVRRATPQDRKDPTWRPFDAQLDTVYVPKSDTEWSTIRFLDLVDSKTDAGCAFYYWRTTSPDVSK